MDSGLFDIDNSIELGAVMGFAEEALREESRGENLDEEYTDDDIIEAEEYAAETTNSKFRLLYNENPALAIHILKRFKEIQQLGERKLNEKIAEVAMDNVAENISSQMNQLYEEMDDEMIYLTQLESDE